jgi:hypothetical protein
MVTEARDRAMYTIELTQGPGWDAPALQSRPVKTTVDIEKVLALAATWLNEVQHASHDGQMPDGWRVVDGVGRRIRTSEIEIAADGADPKPRLDQL